MRPRSVLFAALSAVAAVLLLPVPSVALDQQESSLLQQINAHRSAQGLPSLSLSAGLTRAAQQHSQLMADSNCFSHYCAGEASLWDRVRAAGYPKHSRAVGENIAAGYVAGQEVFEAWKGSPGHNANMLNPSWRAVGIARVYSKSSTYGWYWTVDFGDVLDGSAPERPQRDLKIVTENLPQATAGRYYRFALQAQGGGQPYTWSASGLPAGLTLDSGTGTLRGFARMAGQYRLRVWISDSRGQQVSSDYDLRVLLRNRLTIRFSIELMKWWADQALTAEAYARAKLTVFDLTGRRLLDSEILPATSLEQGLATQLAPLPSGVYLVALVRDERGNRYVASMGKLVVSR